MARQNVGPTFPNIPDKPQPNWSQLSHSQSIAIVDELYRGLQDFPSPISPYPKSFHPLGQKHESAVSKASAAKRPDTSAQSAQMEKDVCKLSKLLNVLARADYPDSEKAHIRQNSVDHSTAQWEANKALEADSDAEATELPEEAAQEAETAVSATAASSSGATEPVAGVTDPAVQDWIGFCQSYVPRDTGSTSSSTTTWEDEPADVQPAQPPAALQPVEGSEAYEDYVPTVIFPPDDQPEESAPEDDQPEEPAAADVEPWVALEAYEDYVPEGGIAPEDDQPEGAACHWYDAPENDQPWEPLEDEAYPPDVEPSAAPSELGNEPEAPSGPEAPEDDEPCAEGCRCLGACHRDTCCGGTRVCSLRGPHGEAHYCDNCIGPFEEEGEGEDASAPPEDSEDYQPESFAVLATSASMPKIACPKPYEVPPWRRQSMPQIAAYQHPAPQPPAHPPPPHLTQQPPGQHPATQPLPPIETATQAPTLANNLQRILQTATLEVVPKAPPPPPPRVVPPPIQTATQAATQPWLPNHQICPLEVVPKPPPPPPPRVVPPPTQPPPPTRQRCWGEPGPRGKPGTRRPRPRGKGLTTPSTNMRWHSALAAAINKGPACEWMFRWYFPKPQEEAEHRLWRQWLIDDSVWPSSEQLADESYQMMFPWSWRRSQYKNLCTWAEFRQIQASGFGVRNVRARTESQLAKNKRWTSVKNFLQG